LQDQYFGKYKLTGNATDYWKYPDGTHCGYKVAVVAKQSTLLSGIWASYIAIHSPATTMYEFMRPFPRIMGPVVAGSVAGVTTACYGAALRGKDDPWNYAAGGLVSGLTLGAGLRSPVWMGYGGFYLALIGAMYKYTKQKYDVTWNMSVNPGWMSGDYDGCNVMPDHSRGESYGKLTGDEPWNLPRTQAGW